MDCTCFCPVDRRNSHCDRYSMSASSWVSWLTCFFFFFLTPIHCHESGCRVVWANQSQPLSHQKTNFGRVEKWDAFNFSSLCDVWFPYCCGVVCCNLQVLIASCELIFLALCWDAITRFLCAAAVAADFADWVFCAFCYLSLPQRLHMKRRQSPTSFQKGFYRA